MSVAAILANWKNITLGALLLACAVLFGLWKWEEAAYANYKVKQAAAVQKAQERADALANELVIHQAIALSGNEKIKVQYVDRIRQAPDDPERLRAIARGLRDITSGRGSPSSSGSPDALPASRADRKP